MNLIFYLFFLTLSGAGSCLETLGAGKAMVVVINELLMGNHQIELADQLRRDGHLFYATPRWDELYMFIVEWFVIRHGVGWGERPRESPNRVNWSVAKRWTFILCITLVLHRINKPSLLNAGF